MAFLLQHRIRHTDSEDSEDGSEGVCFDACRCAPGGACAVGTCGCMAPNTSLWDGPLYDPVTGTLRPLLVADSPPFTIPVFECNSGCTCGPECCNRVTQRRREGAVSAGCSLEVFDTGTARGQGCRTLTPIPKGAFVCEYVGVLVSSDAPPNNYTFCVREHVGDMVIITCVDARDTGGFARFVNHSCEPSLTVVPVRVDTPEPHLCFFATQDILAGQELTVDYGLWGGDGPDPSTSASGAGATPLPLSATPCLCGAARCRRFLPALGV